MLRLFVLVLLAGASQSPLVDVADTRAREPGRSISRCGRFAVLSGMNLGALALVLHHPQDTMPAHDHRAQAPYRAVHFLKEPIQFHR